MDFKTAEVFLCLIALKIFIWKTNAQQGIEIVANTLEDIEAYSSNITRLIKNFHKYEYDDFVEPATTIENGRFGMFDGGNEVTFWEDDRNADRVAEYNDMYRTSRTVFATTIAYPFTALWWIDEAPDNNQSTIQVLSFVGSSFDSMFSSINSTTTYNGFRLDYKTSQLYGSRSPSICEVFFIVQHPTKWRSRSPNETVLNTPGEPNYEFTNTFVVSGNYANVLIGYTLLSKYQLGGNDNEVGVEELRNVMNQLLRFIAISDSPNRPQPPPKPEPFRPEEELVVEMLMEDVENVANNITSQIPSWFSYRYDTNDSVIEDGGSDIFDFGNRVRFKKDVGLFTRALYDKVYYFDDYQFQTRAIHPFVALMWIENKNGSRARFTLQVDGNVGADQEGGILRYSSRNLTSGPYIVSYEVYHIHSANDPSVCEVYFTVGSDQWNSTDSDLLEVISFTDETDEIVNSVRVVGRPQRIVLGYMLLSKVDGKIILETEVRNALTVLADGIGPINPGGVEVGTKEPKEVVDISEPEVDGTQVVDRGDSSSVIANGPLRKIKDMLASTSSIITQRHVYGWHGYSYDDQEEPIDSILNGGADMYNIGNQVSFFDDTNILSFAKYDKYYSFENFDATTCATQPFFALMWIRNPSGSNGTFEIIVEGEVGDGMKTEYEGRIRQHGFACDYKVFQVFNSQPRPSICEVYFKIESRRHWNSVDSKSFEMAFDFTDGYAVNSVRLNGSPQRVLMGYMLLSRKDGASIPEARIKYSFRSILTDLVFNEDTQLSGRQTPLFGQDTTPATSVKDEAFLPNCTVIEALQTMWQCEGLFRRPVKYLGTHSCINTVKEFLDCVVEKLEDCKAGNKTNALDSFNFPSFNFQFFVDSLRNLSKSYGGGNDPVTAFCYHAPLHLTYPHSVSDIPACNKGIPNQLLDRLIDFYYAFVWSRDTHDICTKLRDLRQWFLQSADRSCDLRQLRGFPDLTATERQYLVAILNLASKEIARLPFLSCGSS